MQARKNLRLQQQTEAQSLKDGLGKSSSALSALTRRADKLKTEADASKMLADIGQKSVDRVDAVAEARKAASGATEPAGESALDRLQRLTAQEAPATV